MARELYIKELANKETSAKFVWDYNIKPVTVVAILNYKFDHKGDWPADCFLSSYRLREDSNHEEMTDILRFVFLELGRFKKKVWEVESVFDKWMYLLKHMHEMEEIPKKFSDPLFTRLFLLAEIGNFTAKELDDYKKSIESMGDYENIINTAKEEAERIGREIGMAKGLAEGRAEGRAEERADNIRKMMAAGIPAETIAAALGITVEECLSY